MYGTQNGLEIAVDTAKFENDVKMYGTQKIKNAHTIATSLRMM